MLTLIALVNSGNAIDKNQTRNYQIFLLNWT